MPLYTKVADNAVILATATASPGTGWGSVANVQAAFNQARAANLQLFLRPGTYQTTGIVVDSSSGGGNPIWVTATPGTATLQLTSGANLLTIKIENSLVENITLDVNGVSFANNTSAALSIGDTSNILVRNCRIINSFACGIYAIRTSNVTVRDCFINSCNYGIWGIDSLLKVDGNNISSCFNNGVMIWTSTVTGNSSTITNNSIFSIESGSGTGQNGNGISVFRAVSVTVSHNTISGCKYSAIRFNGGGSAIVSNNNCYGCRETTIFIEAPTAGIDLTGAIVIGNNIDASGGGIMIANSGFGGQGTTKSVIVANNRITNITKWNIADDGYIPPIGNGIGISVEQNSIVNGNLIDGAAGFGIVAGHNAGGTLDIVGNMVVGSPVGIGYSSGSSPDQWLISGNEVRNASSGSIISTTWNDTTAHLAVTSGATDYGNQYDAQIGNVFLGNNRSW